MVYVWIRSLKVNDSKVPAQAQAHTISDSAPLQPAFKMLLDIYSFLHTTVCGEQIVCCVLCAHTL